MKKIENSFAVTGRICRDAEIHLFEYECPQVANQ